MRDEDIRLLLKVLAELVIDDRPAAGPDGKLGPCPWCGGDEWVEFQGEQKPPTVGHDEQCPVNRGRWMLQQVIAAQDDGDDTE